MPGGEDGHVHRAGRGPHSEADRNHQCLCGPEGVDAESAKRIVLVTGHYDSRNSDTLDVAGDAPGANDDASGTAVSLECARVLSKMKFPATIVFLTVAGEEQG